mgnify:CR=1 FL=1
MGRVVRRLEGVSMIGKALLLLAVLCFVLAAFEADVPGDFTQLELVAVGLGLAFSAGLTG